MCDLRELLRVPLRSQGYCAVWRGLLRLLCIWWNVRGTHNSFVTPWTVACRSQSTVCLAHPLPCLLHDLSPFRSRNSHSQVWGTQEVLASVLQLLLELGAGEQQTQRTDLGTGGREGSKSRGLLWEPGAPPRHAHGDVTSLAPHERLPEILVVPQEKTPTGAAARGNP